MQPVRARLRQCLALALLAAAALALLPSVARALQVAPLSLAVCGTGGAAPDGAAPGHCPLCSHFFDGPAGPPAGGAGLAAVAGDAAPRWPASTGIRSPRAAWSSAAARAPPTASC